MFRLNILGLNGFFKGPLVLSALISLSLLLGLYSLPLMAQPNETLELGRQAATNEPPQGESSPSLKVTLGAGLVSHPEIEGSDKYEVTPIPVIELSYDRIFLSLSKGLGVKVIDNGDWTIAPSIRYWGGRDEDDSDLLRGMGDIDESAALGAMISYHPGDLSIFLNAYHGLGEVEGLTAETGVAYSHRFIERLRGTVQLSTMFASQKYNQAFFGVSPKQARNSGYRRYDADSGFKHVALGATVSYNLTTNIDLGVFGEYKGLTGPAADSPIVKEGSKNQVTSGVMVGFNF
ncbi:MAG: MipA/OmpV family protein [Deltaproteobacteria bacterium]|jgi:outer membrane scaffolding protein for murein synthesis (MipA/OmpV family)|nr:MipA/OmpV family protein [Deltaproteobacteria bacterium]